MKKIKKLLKEYKLSLIIAIGIMIVMIGVISIFLIKDIKVRTYANDYYRFKYDETWKIKTKKESTIDLTNNKSSLHIEIMKLNNEEKYNDLNSMIDNLIYQINKQNKDYNLITKQESKVTKKEIAGYKLLYENKNQQALITIYKDNDKLVIFNYESSDKYFDILLDSVQNIIYNFELKNNNYALNTKRNVKTKALKYETNDSLDQEIKEDNDYEIASNNYEVSYSLPKIFKLTSFDSKIGTFEYKTENGRINLTTNVYNYNIYDYVDSQKETNNIYSSFKVYKNDQENYSDFKDSLEEITLNNYKGYIYKVSYSQKETKTESYIIVLALNKNHIFHINLESKNISITKKLIESIKIKKAINYASYIKKNSQDDNLIIELKRINNLNDSTCDFVTFKIPDKYIERDLKNNIYAERNFGLNYDEENEAYQYNIKISLTSNYMNLDSQINLLNSNINYYKTYGDVKELTFIKEQMFNNQNFNVYESKYIKRDYLYKDGKDKKDYPVNEKVLINKLESGGYLVIVVDGNNVEIDDNLLNEITNFQIETKNYE